MSLHIAYRMSGRLQSNLNWNGNVLGQIVLLATIFSVASSWETCPCYLLRVEQVSSPATATIPSYASSWKATVDILDSKNYVVVAVSKYIGPPSLQAIWMTQHEQYRVPMFFICCSITSESMATISFRQVELFTSLKLKNGCVALTRASCRHHGE